MTLVEDDVQQQEDPDDDRDEAGSDEPFGWLRDPYRGAPLGSPFSDD